MVPQSPEKADRPFAFCLAFFHDVTCDVRFLSSALAFFRAFLSPRCWWDLRIIANGSPQSHVSLGRANIVLRVHDRALSRPLRLRESKAPLHRMTAQLRRPFPEPVFHQPRAASAKNTMSFEIASLGVGQPVSQHSAPNRAPAIASYSMHPTLSPRRLSRLHRTEKPGARTSGLRANASAPAERFR